MKNEKGQKELIKELNQLIKQYPDIAVVVLVDNEEKCDTTECQYTKHRIKEVLCNVIVETKNGHIYLSIEDFVREYSEAELESMKDDFDISPAIVIITEADV